MKRCILILLILLFNNSLAYAQNTTKLCVSTNGSNCIPVDASNPLPTISGGGASSTNITQILGAPVSATNPLYISPSTGSTFAATQSGTWNIGSITTLPSLATGGNVIGAVTQSGTWNVGTVTPGAGATNLGKAEDAVASSGDTGVFTLGVRRDTLTTSAGNGDYNEFAVDQYGSMQIRNFEKQAPAYAASGTVVAASSATDIFTITGSASKTVYITKIRVSGIQGTGSTSGVYIIKRSTANSAGTSTAVTAVPFDSLDSAATATVLNYTANPTLGTVVGTVANSFLAIPTSASAAVNNVVEFNFGHQSKSISLRGTSQVIAVNLNTNTFTSGIFLVSIEWYEI